MEKTEITLLLLLCCFPLHAQRIERIPFGDFERWTTRHIKESAIIGGETKAIYVPGPEETIEGNKAYDYSRAPWSTSNAYAKVSGVTKASLSVEPDKGQDGRCARLSTVMESCRVAGLVDIQALVTGSIFWGRTYEPISGVSNPYANMDWGIPFTGHPSAVILDYKAFLPASGKLTTGTTFGKKEIPGEDPCQVMLILQKRWEDAEGRIHALRVGTAFYRIGSTCDWVKDYRIPVRYGDIRGSSFYRPYMALIGGEKALYATNSKGKKVPILEEGWAEEGTLCTHAIMQISSGSCGAFTGEVGNILWVDNLRLEYER